MNNRKILLGALLVPALLGSVRCVAQQDPLYTMYMWNMMTVNPGYAGSADVMNATILGRRQWVGFEGAPATNAFMVHSPLKIRSIGLGFSAIDDRIGPSRSASVNADFAYRIQLTAHSRLAFGLKAGGSLMRLALSDVSGTDANDPVYQRNFSSGFRPNFGFGIYYWSQNRYIGLSAPKLLKEELAGTVESGNVRLYTQELHYFLTAGCVIQLMEEVKFRPSILVRVVRGAPVSADLSANFLFLEKFWAGLSYRTSKSLACILSYQITEQLRAGYAYDISFNGMSGRQGGSHELMLSYDLSFTKRSMRSPRYF